MADQMGQSNSSPEQREVKDYLTRVHSLAAGHDGQLVLCSYGQDPDTGKDIRPKIRRFDIGDIDVMCDTALEWKREDHRNVYLPLSLVRSDLKQNQRGSASDILWTLGLVADFDDENARDYRKRLPVYPDMVLETSPGRFQAFYFFNEPQRPADVDDIALGLQEFAACDHGTKDLAHVWRIPGTLNWPNQKKVQGGRRKPPVRVDIAEKPWMEERGETKTRPEYIRQGLAQPKPKVVQVAKVESVPMEPKVVQVAKVESVPM